MSGAYLNRLIVISDMLESPYPKTVQDGLAFLFELLQENSQDTDFINEVRALAKNFSTLEQKILEMIVQSQHQDQRSLLLPVNSQEKEADIEKMKPRLPKIFISYSHKDEKFKDELVTMLIPLQNHRVLEIWHDRRIEEGEEWYREIKDAMSVCDVALLLVSKHFLASGFIGGEELPHLLQRRKEQGLRVIPIIISQCLWQSVPVLSDLQALPRDGKPVVGFKGAGERDKIWTEIAKVIERRAKIL